MVVVPGPTAKATPVVGLIVATEVLLLVHVPPPVVLANVTTEPTHALEGPMMESSVTHEADVMFLIVLQPPTPGAV